MAVGYTQNVTNTFVLPAQTIQDLQGIGAGAWIRYQQKWTQIETSLGVYSWTNLDTAVSLCNAGNVNILIQIQSPPTFRQTRDGLGSNCTLQSTLNSGTAYTSFNVSALPAGAYIPAGVTLALTYGGNQDIVTTAAPSSGNYYGAGATSINIVSHMMTFSHAVNDQIYEATGGPCYANSSDFATFMGLVAARYNGTAGHGTANGVQVENESYDSNNRIGSQVVTANWNGTSTWDNGGAIFAPVYAACRTAILAQYASVPVVTTAVRRTSNTAQIGGMSPCVQHVQNWCQGFAQHVTGSVDWFDFHFYHGSDADFDGTLIGDPTQSTYFDSGHTQINSPSIGSQLTTMSTALSPLTPTFLCGEFGWDLYDDGTGTAFTLNQNIATNTSYTSIACLALSHGIPNAEGLWITDNSGNVEQVYTFGTIAINATSIAITTDPRGNGTAGYPVAQTAWHPIHTHATNDACYAQATTDTIDQYTVATYFTKLINAMKAVGGHAFCFTMQANAVVTSAPPYPATSTAVKSITQTIGGVYTHLAPYYALVDEATRSAYDALIYTNGPQAYYRLNEPGNLTQALDSTGNGYNAPLSGVTTYGVAGLIKNDTDKAMLFGAAGSLSLPPALSKLIATSWTAMTVEYWIQLSAGPQCIQIASDTTTGTTIYLNGTVYTPGTVASIEIDLYLNYTGSYLAGTLQKVAIYNFKFSATQAANDYAAGANLSPPPPPSNTAPPVPLGMKIILGYVAMPTTDATSVRYKATTADPVPTCSVSISDANSSINVQALQELWIIDGNVIPYPSWNLLQGPGLGTNFGAFWFTYTVGLSTIQIITAGSPPIQFAASAGSGSTFAAQTIQQGLVVAGQGYMFSCYVQAATALVDFQVALQITWQDAAGNTLGSPVVNQFTPTGTRTRYSLSGTAPAGAVSAQIAFGGVSTVSSMASGTINVDTAQFEPMWFPTQLSYPTPDLLPTSTNARMLPNETIIRQYRKFAGLVTHAIAQDYHGNTRTWHIDASGYAWLFGQTFTILSFQQEFDINIISALLSYFWPARQDGTTLFNLSGMIQGVQVSSLQPNWDDLRTIINDLATQAGYFWTIDPYWVFVYQPPGYTQMPYSLICDHSGTPDFVSSFTAYGFKAEMDFTQPGSSILVIGGNVSTTLTGALNQGTYYSTIQVAPIPAPILQGTVLTLSGAQTVTLSANARVGSTTIAVTRFQALFNHGVGASVTSNPYVGNVIDQAASSAYNQMAMYGYGNGQLGIGGIPGSFFMRKINDSALQSVPDVVNRGIAELIQYDNPRWIYHLNTNVELLVGQGIQVTSSTDNLNATTLLIQQIAAQWLGTDEKMNSVWEYQADLGNVNRSAASIMSHIFRQTTVNTSPPQINQTALFLMERFGLTETITGH